MKSRAAAYIQANRDALRQNNPCYWPAYQEDPEGVWAYLFHMIGYGLREYQPADVKREIGSLYGLVPQCCIIANRLVPVDAKQVIKWIMERYEQDI